LLPHQLRLDIPGYRERHAVLAAFSGGQDERHAEIVVARVAERRPDVNALYLTGPQRERSGRNVSQEAKGRQQRRP